jgi:dipeptidyl aminopeptidase/acylaminoacyl peptidase
MKQFIAASLAALAIAMASTASAREMTATDLATMKRIGAPAVSPDGRWVAYQQRETDLDNNRGRIDLWLLDLNAPNGQAVRIASTPEHNEQSPAFSADGRWLYFLSNASGSDQLWRVALPSGTPERVTDLANGISGYALAPGGERVALWADLDRACEDFNCANVPELEPRGSARVYDETFVRHWDSWIEPGIFSRIFTFPMADGRPQGGGIAVSGVNGNAPTKPFGGGEEIAWSPDGRTLYFTLREAGRDEPLSTNLDIYAVPADGSVAPVNLTAANRATDTMPAVSPDGRWLAYAAMARPGYEADRLVVQLRDLRSGETRALTADWDRSVGSIAWAPDSRSLLVTAQDTLDTPLFRVDARSGAVTRLTERGTVGNVVPTREGAVFTLNNVGQPDDLYRLDRENEMVQVTAVNAALLAQLDPVSYERFSFTGANGDTVWGQIVRPAEAEGGLPVAFLIHGGPQGSFGNSWSYRWNPRLFSAPGYAAVSVDFHGSTGYGQAFTDSINRDWGGAPLEDLRLGLAAAGRHDATLDIANACALGGSYGGYMTTWIAGAWPDGFKCLVTHAGIFDLRAMAYETEELWFTEWEFGGPYFLASEAYERHNPVSLVDRWRTPTLVIHGELDFRIPYSQSLGIFTALQRRNIPSRLVVYPDENHWILRPQNSIQWYREVHGWLDRWLRPSN